MQCWGFLHTMGKRMKFVAGLIRIIDNCSEWTGKIFSYLQIGIVVVLVIEVVMRYIFKDPTVWAYELSLYLFSATVMLCGAFTLLHDGHVKMDVVYGRLSKRNRAIIDIVTFVFFVIFIGALTWKGTDIALKSIHVMERSDTAWRPYIWPSRLIVAIGAFLILIQGFSNFIKNIAFLCGKHEY